MPELTKSNRDDFTKKDKDLLAKRVGFRCSNPKCRRVTSGPCQEDSKFINIGVAAHIKGASPGGARYDSKQSSEERRSKENGIWLCQNCAKLIDSDDKKYTSELLFNWKKLSEIEAQLDVENPNKNRESMTMQIFSNSQIENVAGRDFNFFSEVKLNPSNLEKKVLKILYKKYSVGQNPYSKIVDIFKELEISGGTPVSLLNSSKYLEIKGESICMKDDGISIWIR